MHTVIMMLSVKECSTTPLALGPAFGIEEWMDESRCEIERHLDQLLTSSVATPLNEAMRYSVLAPGKRLRPLLVLAIARFFELSPPGIMKVACVIEMIHSASLVLDDLPCMDNDHERRNRLATHARFGEDLSILAAVSLLMHSHCILAADDSLRAEARLKLIRLFCDTVGSGGLSLGQYIDLNPALHSPDTFSVTDVHHLKTGILFVAAARAACLLCNATAAQEAAVVEFTTKLGLAFQARDDLADLDRTESNLVTAIGVANARQRYHDYLDAAHEAIDGEPNAAVLQGLAASIFRAKAA